MGAYKGLWKPMGVLCGPIGANGVLWGLRGAAAAARAATPPAG